MQRAHKDPEVSNIIPILADARNFDKKRRYDKSHLVHLFMHADVFWVDYRFDGKRIRESLGISNRKTAELQRADLEHKIRAGLYQQAVQISLSDFLDKYLEFIGGKLAHKNASSQKSYFSRFLKIHPRANVSDVSQAMIEAFLAGIKNAAPSPKTWNIVRGSFHAMLNYAKDHGYCVQNVATKVERRSVPEKTIRFLRSQE